MMKIFKEPFNSVEGPFASPAAPKQCRKIPDALPKKCSTGKGIAKGVTGVTALSFPLDPSRTNL